MGRNRSVLRNPGIILTIAMAIETIIIFAWWPKEPGAFGVAKVNWLLIFIYFVWLIQCFIYIPWIEKIEGKKGETNK